MKIISPDKIPQNYFSGVAWDDEPIVDEIIKNVREEGDLAVREYTAKFDGIDRQSYEVSEADIKNAYEQIDSEKLDALRFAAGNIEKFAKLQKSMFKDIESDENGYTYGHKIIPIQKTGCYVPGGRYPLPSSALMTIIPARIAGVEEIVVCSPKIAMETIVAADIAGATQIFEIGGAQAIAAMAYGTQTIPKVDKIVGPGNRYVTSAKRKVFGEVGIDFIAGPSEVMILADDTADPEIVAADLLAQAEHDTLARADLITTSTDLAEKVLRSVNTQLEMLSTYNIASEAISNSFIILVDDWIKAIEIVNRRAPEHLELQTNLNDELINSLHNYGSLFLGPFSAEVFGDYCSGPNHTLPTNRVARYTGGLSVKEYIKVVSYQKLNGNSIPQLIENASKLAQMEGLHAHQKAAEIRKKLL